MRKFTQRFSPWWVFFGFFLVVSVVPLPSGGGNGFNIIHNGVVLVAIAMSLLSCIFKKEFFVDYFFFLFAFISLLLFTPALWTSSDLNTVVLRFLFMVVTCFWVFSLSEMQSKDNALIVLRSLLLLILVQALFSLVLYFILIPFSIIYTVQAPRMTGIFLQPNSLSSFFATGVLLAGYLYRLDSIKTSKLMSKVALVLLPALIVFSQSKTGLLGSLLGLVLLSIVGPAGCDKNWKVIWGLFLIGIIIGGIVYFLDVSLRSGFERPAESHMVASKYRLVHYLQSLQLIGSSPEGMGFGKFAQSFIQSWVFSRATWAQDFHIEPNLFHPHNELLYWGVEGGVFSLVVLFAFIVFIIFVAFKRGGGVTLCNLSLLIPLVVHSMLEYPFYQSFLHWIVFLLLVKNLVGYGKCLKISSLYPVLIGFFLFLFSLTGIQTAYYLNLFRSDSVVNEGALTNILNPFVLKHELEYALSITSLNSAINLNSEAVLRSELDFAYEVSSVMPQVNLYLNIIQAEVMLGNITQAEKMLKIVNEVYLAMLGREDIPIDIAEFMGSQ